MSAPAPAPYLFLVNPRAGGRLGRAVAAFVLEALERRGLVLDRDFKMEFTRPGEVVAQAAEAAARAPIVVAVGGDGTILETIRGLVSSGRDTALGVIPLGTGNDFSRTLGLYRPIGPRSRRAVERICDVILARRTTPVDLLEINGRLLFASYFSFGVDAKVACAFARLRPRLSGGLLESTLANKTFLFLLGLRYLGDSAPDGVRLRVAGADGRFGEVSLPRRVKTLIVSNIRHWGGGARVSPTAELADGRFEVTVVPTAVDFLRLLFTRFRYAPAEAPWWPKLPSWQTNRIQVEPRGATSFQIDGEDATDALVGQPVIDIRVGPRLSVVSP
jgi:diacylglycerol kinase family enzyme